MFARKLIMFALFAAPLTVIACGEKDSDACSSDNDCKGDRICSSGECVDPSSGGGGNNGTGTGNNSTGTGNNGTGTGNNGTGTGNNGSSSTFDCCLNGEYYNCPDETSLNMCGQFDPSGCARDASGDASMCDGGTGNNGTGNNGTGNNGTGNNGGAGGEVGDSCREDADCATNLCLFDSGAVVGYCTAPCDSFADCPTFWDCAEVSNGSGTYCIQD